MQQSTTNVTSKNGLFIKVAKEVTLSLGVAALVYSTGYYIFEEEARKQDMENRINSLIREQQRLSSFVSHLDRLNLEKEGKFTAFETKLLSFEREMFKVREITQKCEALLESSKADTFQKMSEMFTQFKELYDILDSRLSSHFDLVKHKLDDELRVTKGQLNEFKESAKADIKLSVDTCEQSVEKGKTQIQETLHRMKDIVDQIGTMGLKYHETIRGDMQKVKRLLKKMEVLDEELGKTSSKQRVGQST